jgi:hypothetical protein
MMFKFLSFCFIVAVGFLFSPTSGITADSKVQISAEIAGNSVIIVPDPGIPLQFPIDVKLPTKPYMPVVPVPTSTWFKNQGPGLYPQSKSPERIEIAWCEWFTKERVKSFLTPLRTGGKMRNLALTKLV